MDGDRSAHTHTHEVAQSKNPWIKWYCTKCYMTGHDAPDCDIENWSEVRYTRWTKKNKRTFNEKPTNAKFIREFDAQMLSGEVAPVWVEPAK